MAAMAAASTSVIDSNQVEPEVVGAAYPSGFGVGRTVEAARGEGGLRLRTPPPSVGRGFDDEEEEDQYEYVDQEFPTPNERKWSVYLVAASVADILVSGIIIIVAFRFAYRANGVSLYCLAIQAISHFISSLLLAIRFRGELSLPDASGGQSLLRRHKRATLVREQILSECMGVVMLISSAALLFKAFRKINFWDKWYLDHRNMDKEAEWATEFLAWYGFAVYVLNALFRFVAARHLRRSILWHGFVASVVSLVFLFVLGFAASYEKEWSWKAEPIAAIGLSFLTLFEGTRIIIVHLDDMDTRLRFDPRA